MKLVASTYGWGEPLNKNNADGSVFNPSALTVAHRTLPFGTRLRITNPATGKSVVAVVRDRGPAASTGRTIDLSRGVAETIGFGKSVGPVEVAILAGPPAPAPKAGPPTPQKTPVATGVLVRPLPGPVPSSSFRNPDGPEGVDGPGGQNFHGAVDWFADAGTPVRAPADGEVIEVKPSPGNSGQVFGGTVKVQLASGAVFVARHVDPAVTVGQRVKAGDPVAAVAAWTGGPPHGHIEIWKSAAGGYNIANMVDPAEFFTGAVNADEFPFAFPPLGNVNDRDLLEKAGGAVTGWVGDLTKWLEQWAILAMAYLALAAIGVWLAAQGAHEAVGTPSPADVAGAAIGKGQAA
jgi:murein DD-endopeptidase MepM/ murein hydrolase activator NlpD